jgi:hypothetical protein
MRRQSLVLPAVLLILLAASVTLGQTAPAEYPDYSESGYWDWFWSSWLGFNCCSGSSSGTSFPCARCLTKYDSYPGGS